MNSNITETKQTKRVGRNIPIDYVFCFMKNFDISSAIWVLYMVDQGLSLWHIGIVEGIFHITSVAFEVPSGAIADLCGRKQVLLAGRLCSALSAILCLFSNSVVEFSIAFMISAVGYNLNSGSEEALVYDSLKEVGKEAEYLKVNSRLNVIIEIAQGLATFVGGVLAEYSFVYCYGVVIVLSLLSILPCMLFEEPCLKGAENKEQRVSVATHFHSCYQLIRGDKTLLFILLYYPIIFTFHAIVYFYGQQYFSVQGCNKISISLIMLLGGVFGCLGALSCEKVMAKFQDKTKYLASFVMAISILGVSGHQLWVSIACFAVMNYVNSLLYPMQSEALHRLISSEQRATILSVQSMVYSAMMIALFPICGLLADWINLHTTFFLLGILQLLFLLWLRSKRRG